MPDFAVIYADKQILALFRDISRKFSNYFNMSYSNLQGKIKIYRYCDNVWTFLMTNTEFRDAAEGFHADRVKIVACDGGTCLSNIISNLYSLLTLSGLGLI